jgi:hypothetical protein
VFIATDTDKATNTLDHEKSADFKREVASAIPSFSRNTGVPAEKIVIAILIPIPKKPQTMARGIIPKVFEKYVPVLMRCPNISPIVERIPNFKKLIIIPCAALNDLYHSYTGSMTKNGKNNATTHNAKIKSLFFIVFVINVIQ